MEKTYVLVKFYKYEWYDIGFDGHVYGPCTLEEAKRYLASVGYERNYYNRRTGMKFENYYEKGDIRDSQLGLQIIGVVPLESPQEFRY